MKIVDVAVGALHCLALNDQGEVMIMIMDIFLYLPHLFTQQLEWKYLHKSVTLFINWN